MKLEIDSIQVNSRQTEVHSIHKKSRLDTIQVILIQSKGIFVVVVVVYLFLRKQN